MNETIDDIIKWLRYDTVCYAGHDKMKQLADRIEEALERERKIDYSVKCVIDENARLRDENYNLLNELRSAKIKEEDIEYEYAIQQKFRGEWTTVARSFFAIDEVRGVFNFINEKGCGEERRIVCRPLANWEEVK